MKVSIVVICDVIREKSLLRLFSTIKPHLSLYDAEVLLLHECSLKKSYTFPIPIRMIKLAEKQGFSYNRNQGISSAKGDIIVFIDDDCWVQKEWLTSLVEPLIRDQTLLAVTGETKIPPSNLVGDSISALGFPGGGSIGFSSMWKVSREGFTNHLTVGNCAVRREIFTKVGLFDESMKSGAEDAEFSYRMERMKIPIKYSPRGYAYHDARDTFLSFAKWQLRRGRANYQFKKKVKRVGNFVKLRLWSTKNILRKNKTNWRLPLILFFLGTSFLLQQLGYFQEKYKHEHRN